MYKRESGVKFEKVDTDLRKTTLDVSEDFLQPTFCASIVGPPGSGKTTLLYNLLSQPRLYYKKFNKIIFLTPSLIGDIELTYGENAWPTIKLSWILEKLEEQSQLGQMENKTRQVLIIIDDLVSDLQRMQNDDSLVKLFYNRRHYLPDIHVHFLITTQKWNMIPARFRSTFTAIFCFPVSHTEWHSMAKEIRIENLKLLEKFLVSLWTPNTFIIFNLLNNKIFHNFDQILM